MRAQDPGLEELLKRTSRSLYLSLSVLPRPLREPMGLGYLLCRAADTIADTRLVPKKDRLRALEAYRDAFERPEAPLAPVLDRIGPGLEQDAESALIGRLSACLAAYRVRPADEKELLKAVVDSVAEGMRFDLSYFPGDDARELKALETPEQTIRYCELIGGGPGLFWSRLCHLKLGGENLDGSALRLGRGLQMINILRDLPKDLRLGRCYFPDSDLKAHGIAVRELLLPAELGRLRGVLIRWARWTLEELEAGEAYVRAQRGLRLRAAAGWPLLLALKTLDRTLANEKLLEPERPSKVPRRAVYGLIARSPLTLAVPGRFERECRRLRELVEARL